MEGRLVDLLTVLTHSFLHDSVALGIGAKFGRQFKVVDYRTLLLRTRIFHVLKSSIGKLLIYSSHTSTKLKILHFEIVMCELCLLKRRCVF